MELPEFARHLAESPDKAGFVLDFDGTLSAVVAERDRAAPVEGAVEVLEGLARRYRTVALVSGRRAEDLYEVVHASGIEYVGVWGAEKLVDGRLVQPDRADEWRGMASRLTRDAEALIVSEGLGGCQVEYKDLALSIHFRNAADVERAREILTSWAEVSASKRGFDANAGRMIVELRPRGVSKGEALAQIVSENELGQLVAAGDDSSDISLLRMAKDLLADEALTVGVRSAEEPPGLEEVSDLLIESPTAMVELLREFL